MKILTSRIFLIGIVVTLIVIPFFWMKPGELDIGGDGTSMFFYDPVNYIRNFVIYMSYSSGTGVIGPLYFYLPVALLVAVLNTILHSQYLINVLYHSLKLVAGFLSIYALIKEILFLSIKDKFEEKKNIGLQVELTAILTGLFYIFLPTIIQFNNYVNPMMVQDFLNPLIFFLALRYILTRKIKYILFIILLSLIFSQNFSYFASPTVLSFYPLAFLFLIIYTKVVLKKTLPIKGIILATFLFAGIHAFHWVPEFFDTFTSGSNINTRVFSKEDNARQLQYFQSILSLGDPAGNILQPSQTGRIWVFLSFLSPLILILGFLHNKKKSLTFLLTALFFLISFFFLSAKVSYMGVKLYELFFLYIPAFSMFRSFTAQWLCVFSFFYALLFGQALFFLLMRLNNTKRVLLAIVLFVYIVGSAWTFINGELFNSFQIQSKQVGKHIIMDPKYEDMLSFIRQLPFDGKIITFPLTDFNYQVIHGIGNGAYVGNSTIGQLTGVKDFAGYWHVAPYIDAFLNAAKEKNYVTLRRIFAYLNIRYIFHNSDPKIYDDTFPGRPYSYVKKILPSDQKSYEEFIKPLIGEKLFESGPYRLYSIDDMVYIPHFYIPKEVVVYKNDPKYNNQYAAASSFILDKNKNINQRTIFVETNTCEVKSHLDLICKKSVLFDSIPQISFKKINPLKYYIKVINAKAPFVLVLSESFHKSWKVFESPDLFDIGPAIKSYFDGEIKEGRRENIFFNKRSFETINLKSIPEEQHFTVNGYANAWLIKPEDVKKIGNYTLIVEMTEQRIFFLMTPLSIFVLLLLFMLVYKRRIDNGTYHKKTNC